MTYRNNTEAENLRLKAELEAKEKALKEATDKLNKLERDEELDELEKKLVKEPSWLDRKLEERRIKREAKVAAEWNEKVRKRGTMNYPSRRLYGRVGHDWWHDILIGLFIFGVAAFIIFAFCSSVYHYATDFQSGTVVSRERIPGHMSCHRDSDGHRDCHWVPESFHVTIQNEQGETATWGVSSSEYNSAHEGDYFCYTDLFHDVDGCTPSTTSERGFH